MTEPVNHRHENREQYDSTLTKVAASFGFLFLSVVTSVVFFRYIPKDLLMKAINAHFVAVTGVPLSAISATLVIAMFRATAGKIEFELPGVKFHGASGPTVLWVFCFLAFITGIRLLWAAG